MKISKVKGFKKIVLVLTLCIMGIVFMGATEGGCDGSDTTGTQKLANTSAFAEQDATEKSQQNFDKNQAAYFPSYSSERENINKKTKLFEDPNLIGYIYEIDYGNIVGFFDVKGKVTCSNSQLTNTSQIIKNNAYQGYDYTPIESPQPDGTYGPGGNSIYWFDTKGAYHEWSGTYQYSSIPLKMNAQALLSAK